MGYSLHYYDLVLACIAVSLGLGALIGYATPVAIELSIVVLGIVAIGFIGHALFVNGPVDAPEELTEEIEVEEVPKVLSPMESPE
ncbi:hypothetical protein [Halosolutus gelatinilyticus]|uniref:hypothetical protein n=1 Tax=Halosolutus gelatinilyticus TaxID=2931975 RepID=UPI001FF3D47C|nr:hypothetical protein [Halosolutus gelatinilyticus]